jgi:catechol 2,3-dioxygenase-like lactoylglutathione lyase family enzyme
VSPQAAAGGPRLLSALPTLIVPDVRAASEHYRDKLGFRICFVVGEHPDQFAIVDRAPGQGVHLRSAGGLAGRSNRSRGGQAIDAYLRVPDADAAHADLVRRGAHLLSEPKDEAWGRREFGVADGDGFVWCVGAELTGAWPEGRVTTSPEFVVEDVPRAAAWYRHVLGFDVETWGDPPAYAIARRDGVHVHLSPAPDGRLPDSNGEADIWDVCFECEGVDALCTEFRGRGAGIGRPPTSQPYAMRDFDVHDLDGYVLCFAQEIEAPD